MKNTEILFKEVTAAELNGNGRDMVTGFSIGFGIAVSAGALALT